MRKVLEKSTLLSILLILVLSITFSAVFADLGSWSTHMFAVNISGTSDGISGKMVNDPVGAIWAANILTYVDGPQISLNLGWNWFSGTEKCGTVFTKMFKVILTMPIPTKELLRFS